MALIRVSSLVAPVHLIRPDKLFAGDEHIRARVDEALPRRRTRAIAVAGVAGIELVGRKAGLIHVVVINTVTVPIEIAVVVVPGTRVLGAGDPTRDGVRPVMEVSACTGVADGRRPVGESMKRRDCI